MSVPLPHAVSLQSSTLTSAAYDNHQRNLQLQFRDGTHYLYHGVPTAIYTGLLTAPSKGVYFNRCIRGLFPYTQLTADYVNYSVTQS